MLEIKNAGKVSSELFRAVLNNVHAYVLLIDEDFRVLLTNYYDLTNTEESTVIKRVGDLLHCRNALRAAEGCGTHEACSTCSIRQKITAAFTEKLDFSDFESFISILNDDCSLADCDVSISAKYLKSQAVPMLVLTIHDVTQMKKIQHELELARTKAELANKSKSMFLANMNHEIRTPLNAIVGFSELLVHAETEEEKEQYLDIVRVNNRLLQQLTNDILDLAKIEAGTLEFIYADVDIHTLMSNVEQSIRMRLGDKAAAIQLLSELPAESHVVRCDENRLMQVLTNFLTNAIKFTDKGSVTMGYYPREKDYYFYVIDTGHGISREKRYTIFDRFTRIEKDKQGTGLGLAICRTIIEKFGGKIGVESELAVGSTFWFTLPK